MKEQFKAIVLKHRRHVEQSPGAGEDLQTYALLVLDDVMADLAALQPARGEGAVAWRWRIVGGEYWSDWMDMAREVQYRKDAGELGHEIQYAYPQPPSAAGGEAEYGVDGAISGAVDDGEVAYVSGTGKDKRVRLTVNIYRMPVGTKLYAHPPTPAMADKNEIIRGLRDSALAALDTLPVPVDAIGAGDLREKLLMHAGDCDSAADLTTDAVLFSDQLTDIAATMREADVRIAALLAEVAEWKDEAIRTANHAAELLQRAKDAEADARRYRFIRDNFGALAVTDRHRNDSI